MSLSEKLPWDLIWDGVGFEVVEVEVGFVGEAGSEEGGVLSNLGEVAGGGVGGWVVVDEGWSEGGSVGGCEVEEGLGVWREATRLRNMEKMARRALKSSSWYCG